MVSSGGKCSERRGGRQEVTFFCWFTTGGCKGPEVETCLFFSETARSLVHVEGRGQGNDHGPRLQRLGQATSGRGGPCRGLIGHCKILALVLKEAGLGF